MLLLSDIPVEVLLDNILPFCAVPDILALGATNRFLALLANDDTFWKRRIDVDFNFRDPARTTGWKLLYKWMSNPRLFVWGEKANGRLGLSKIPKTTLNDVPYPVQLRIPNVRVVSLVAGGMSFHALDSLGHVHVWGTLDGTSTALRSDGFSEASKSASSPLKLDLPAPTRSISCGRLHSSTLDSNYHVWTFLNWGRPFRLVSNLLDCKSRDSTPAQIECGWSFTSVLTKAGGVLVFWPSEGEIGDSYRSNMEALDQDQTMKVQATSENTIPCHTWNLEKSPFMLPPLPPLPDLPITYTGLDEDMFHQETTLIKIAAMDGNIIGLTNKGHLVKYSGLSSVQEFNEQPNQPTQWEYLPLFSDVTKVREHPVFASSDAEEAKVQFTSQHMCITHISANFRTFIAYSTGSSSIVLMGSAETGAGDRPTIIPELQNKSVISVVLGDYHYGALTSSGTLYTWGQYSHGALGLGDPTQLDPGSRGGFSTEMQRVHARDRHFGSPANVTVPTEVNFNHNMKSNPRRYCFAVAAAGWHMGALVVDLDEVEDETDAENVEEVPTERTHVPPTNRGRGIFRVGLAGRGMGRGLPPLDA